MADIYMNSKTLGLPIKYNTGSESVTVKDEVQTGQRGYVEYSSEEMNILNNLLGEITPAVHMVKKVFNAVVVRGIDG